MSPSPRMWDRQPGELVACGCGCGETVRHPDVRGRPRRFVRGHGRGEHRPAVPVESTPCECGCGEPCRSRFIWGHNFRGKTHSLETRAVLATKASFPKPWLRGEGNGMSGRTGPLNPRYIDGSSPERQRAYASAEWKRVRRLVFARDGYRCHDCGEERFGAREMHLHHVQSWAGHPELRLDPDNLLVLCRECHHDRHRKEVLL